MDFNVEAVFGIGVVDDGMINAAMIGLGEPIGAEADFMEGIGGRGDGDCGSELKSLEVRHAVILCETVELVFRI